MDMEETEKMDDELITVWIVEDDLMFRKSLVRGLQRRNELDCGASFASYEAMFAHVEEDGNLWPDVVLMDIGLAGGSGLDGIRLLAEKAPEVKTLVLTVFSDRDKLMIAMDTGASGYLLKRASVSEIVQGIKDVLGGETVLDNKMINFILDKAKSASESDVKLAPREKELLQLFK